MEAAERIVLPTGDGSHTISIPALGITYHSRFGAFRESEHVFINAGLYYVLDANKSSGIRILEMGFGTGLNALLTSIEIQKIPDRTIRYDAVELYPLSPGVTDTLNYTERLGFERLFKAIHDAPWNAVTPIHKQFTLHKMQGDLLDVAIDTGYHLIYYDAFAPEAQPELWTEAVFIKLYDALVDGGILVTYCSKGSARRAMKAAGFNVKKLPGPPGKWEIVRAVKSPGELSR